MFRIQHSYPNKNGKAIQSVAYSAAYPDKTGKMVQLNVANIWKEMKAILELATHGCAADERRSTDKLRTIKSIDELNAEF